MRSLLVSCKLNFTSIAVNYSYTFLKIESKPDETFEQQYEVFSSQKCRSESILMTVTLSYVILSVDGAMFTYELTDGTYILSKGALSMCHGQDEDVLYSIK